MLKDLAKQKKKYYMYELIKKYLRVKQEMHTLELRDVDNRLDDVKVELASLRERLLSENEVNFIEDKRVSLIKYLRKLKTKLDASSWGLGISRDQNMGIKYYSLGMIFSETNSILKRKHSGYSVPSFNLSQEETLDTTFLKAEIDSLISFLMNSDDFLALERNVNQFIENIKTHYIDS